MGDEILLVERDGGVVTATLNRPHRRNALNGELFGALRELFDCVAHEPEDRVLVLRGAGGTFSSGGDLAGGVDKDAARDASGAPPDPQAGSPRRAVESMRGDVGRCALALHELRKPVLAAVEGTAAGAGANLAFGCDLVYATPGARFVEIFVKRGLSLDFGGSWLLPRLVGLRQAKRLALFGEPIGAEEALALGLVTEVLPEDGFHAAVAERARQLAALPPLALSMIKSALDRSAELSFAESVEVEAVAQAVCATSPDAREALAAFLEKRPPRF
jgi:2-(1,2-epoxy-1,2-dihydrophenyl)acetyl-CoA isomerase